MSAIKLGNLTAGSGSFRLHSLNLQVPPGETLALLGPSGSGKSTLLNVIAGFEPVISGTIEIAGVDARALAPERRGIAYLLQALGLWDHLSAQQNVSLVAKSRGGGAIASELLDRVGFAADRSLRVSELSGGERQRVGVARVLACGAPLILLDEPGTHLDRTSRARIAEVFRQAIRESNASAIVVGHELDEILRYRPDRVALLESGRLLQQGETAQVLAAPASRSAAAMVGFETFLPGRSEGGTVECALGRFEARPGPAAKVLLGWRPGAIRLADAGTPARVTERVSTPQGPGAIVELEMGERVLALGSCNGQGKGAHFITCDAPTMLPENGA